MTTDAPRGAPRNTRSWKNLLINRRYQLRFTLFMVGLAAVLMTGLGIWVLREADEATTIGKDSIAGNPCPRVPELGHPIAPEGDGADPTEIRGASTRRVRLEESSMTAAVPKHYPNIVVAHWLCENNKVATMKGLDRGRAFILWELIATGVLLVIGLAVYGIAMTHKVAGPLYKVSLYFTKMRDGHYGAVSNLRKRDQLVAFFDRFKAAHTGVVKMEQDDIAQIRALLAAAEAAGASDHASVAELRALLERKEKSLE